MSIKVVNKNTGRVDRVLTRLYMDALNNDRPMKIPNTHRLTAGGYKKERISRY